MTIAWISLSPAASEQQDLPPPGVGEDLRLRRRLRKIVEKYGVGFFAIRRPWYKTGAKRSHDGQKSMGGAPRGWARHLVPFLLPGSVCVVSKLSFIIFGKILMLEKSPVNLSPYRSLKQ